MAASTELTVHLVTVSVPTLARSQHPNASIGEVMDVRLINKLQEEPPFVVHEVLVTNAVEDALQVWAWLHILTTRETALDSERSTTWIRGSQNKPIATCDHLVQIQGKVPGCVVSCWS